MTALLRSIDDEKIHFSLETERVSEPGNVLAAGPPYVAGCCRESVDGVVQTRVNSKHRYARAHSRSSNRRLPLCGSAEEYLGRTLTGFFPQQLKAILGGLGLRV